MASSSSSSSTPVPGDDLDADDLAGQRVLRPLASAQLDAGDGADDLLDPRGWTFTPPTLMTSEVRPAKRIRSPTTSTTSLVGRQPVGVGAGVVAVVAEHPDPGAGVELAVDDLELHLGVVAAARARRRAGRCGRRAPTRRCRTRWRRRPGTSWPPGTSGVRSLDQAGGMASPPRVICSRRRGRARRRRGSRVRKRQKVGVALAWVTLRARMAARASRGRLVDAGRTRAPPLATEVRAGPACRRTG